MCKLVLRSFFFCLVLASCSSLAYALENQGSLPQAVSSEQSGQQSSGNIFPEMPEAPKPQITPQMTLEQKQAATLQAWIEWYNLVNLSWSKAKNSYEKLDAARVLEINSRDIQIAALNAEMKRLKVGNYLFGAGGFAAGWAAARLMK